MAAWRQIAGESATQPKRQSALSTYTSGFDPEPTVTKPDRVTAMQRLRPFAIEPLDRVAWREAVIARSRYHDVALYNAILGG